MDILLPILIISGIAVAAGVMLNIIGDSNKFDERQLIERGRAASLAVAVALCYLLGIYVGFAFELLHMEYMAIFAVYGLFVTTLVQNGYCIFHDAFLTREQKLGTTVLHDVSLGLAWLVWALARSDSDIQLIWLSSALSLMYLSQGVLLLLRSLILRIRDRRAEKEEADGEE